MKNTIFLMCTLLVVALSAAVGQPEHGRTMMDKLSLTDSQQEQFQKIAFDMKKKAIELKAKTATAKLELHRMMTGESIDKGAMEKKMTEIASYQVALRMNKVNMWSNVNKLLTSEQQKVWKKNLMRDHGSKKKRHGERMMMREHRMDGDMDHDMHPGMERKIEKRIIKK